MIPTIGVMIAGYIMFRCCDVLCRPDTSFSSNAGRITMQVLAFLGILANVIMALDLLFSGATAGLKLP